MRLSFRRLAFPIVLALTIGVAPQVSVSAATMTARVAVAQGADTKVWVNRSSGVYHCPGTRYYGATKRGEYMLESEAVKSGTRPAYGRQCGVLSPSPREALPSKPSAPLPVKSGGSPQSKSAVQVWVNTKTGVYHCPGSRYYGNTKNGVYTAEADAASRGNRPAYGKSCS